MNDPCNFKTKMSIYHFVFTVRGVSLSYMNYKL